MHHNEEDFEIIALLYSLTGLLVWGWSIKNVSFIGRVKLGLYYIFCTENAYALVKYITSLTNEIKYNIGCRIENFV